MKVFELPYYVSNGGDGSANVRFCKSFDEADNADMNQSEGWGESSASQLQLYFDGTDLYFENYDWDDDSTTYGQKVKVLVQQKG